MSRTLSAEQVDRYWRDGILFPLPALSPEEVAYYRARVEELEAALGGLTLLSPDPAARIAAAQSVFK